MIDLIAFVSLVSSANDLAKLYLTDSNLIELTNSHTLENS